jgi:DNA-binding transcriptional LysR family regulator
VPTLKQLDALHWIAALGSFERAAERLGTTQSAVSKRIRELEAALGVEIFDRNQRGARLTAIGEAVLATAGEMRDLRDRLLDFAGQDPPSLRRLRFGVTELTAMTWLPAFVSGLRAAYPRAALEPEVEQSADLLDRLESGSLDFIVVPDVFWHSACHAVPLGSVENAWFSSPGLVGEPHPIGLDELMTRPILVQGNRSGSGLFYERWLHQNGASPRRVIRSNSMTALVGLTMAGIGISYMPRLCLGGMVASGDLRIVESDPPLPPVTYVLMVRAGEAQTLVGTVTDLARRTCDFSRPVRWS